jgi:hypothetical protein
VKNKVQRNGPLAAVRLSGLPAGRIIRGWLHATDCLPATDLELENKRKVARTLREAVPALEKICDEHRSERLRNTAARYLQYIESEVGRSDRG